MQAPIDDGTCRLTGGEQIGEGCLQWGERNGRRWCTEPDDPIFAETYSCSRAIDFPNGREIDERRVASEARNEGQCEAAVADQLQCDQVAEMCTDAEPATRMVGGLALTRACWNWERVYQCIGTRQNNDCSALDAKTQCTFDHEQCLDDPQVGACKVRDRVYRCKSAPTKSGDQAYICGGDLYCLNGECTQVEREASTEFKDAMVAVQTLGDIRDDFDSADLTLFKGEDERCSQKLFGLSNCCSGKGVPLLTPWLCNAADRAVDTKDDKGLCHKVGSYCSDSVFGICVTRKQSYCCFSSKLTRILQEQGRAQIGKGWGAPKRPVCTGFTVAEFQTLDLSRMDFTEVYAEFADAARVPDEVGQSIEMQRKIEEYYRLHGRVG